MRLDLNHETKNSNFRNDLKNAFTKTNEGLEKSLNLKNEKLKELKSNLTSPLSIG